MTLAQQTKQEKKEKHIIKRMVFVLYAVTKSAKIQRIGR